MLRLGKLNALLKMHINAVLENNKRGEKAQLEYSASRLLLLGKGGEKEIWFPGDLEGMVASKQAVTWLVQGRLILWKNTLSHDLVGNR